MATPSYMWTPWRNGSASDSRSEGCVFESRRGQLTSFVIILKAISIEKNKKAVQKGVEIMKQRNKTTKCAVVLKASVISYCMLQLS